MKASTALAWGVILVGVLSGVARAEEEPLHSLIDQRLTPLAGAEPARCSDADFLRRVSLDLAGMPPTADEARAFITDQAADKRQRLIDRLLASPHFVRHLAAFLDIMLMERRPNTHVSADEWQAWLVKSVRENKPWNVLAREILQADGDDPAQRPTARFALDRASEPNVLTRDIGRVFFGRDMQCAQCHDHPLIDNYLQSDYHGLLAFVAPCYALVRTEGDKQKTVHAEKAGADLTFESVFVKVPRRTGARIPDGVVIEEPLLLPGEEYEVPPADNVKPVPKFSRRAKLAELATSGSNQAFNRNIVNRLWALMFGRGIVHPLDLHHPANPATDPELLRLLSVRFAAMNFDIRNFLRELALSGAYQRSFELPAELLSLSEKAAAEVARLQEERAAIEHASSASADAYSEASAAWEEAEATMLPVAGELDAAKNQYAEAKKKMDEAVKAAADVTTQLEAKQKVAGPLEQAAAAAQQAAQALAEDKELADAAQKFVARSQQIAAELVTLAKTAEEKQAAVEPSTEAWNSTKPTVDAAVSKVTPLNATFRQTEQAMFDARTKAQRDAEALAALDRRLNAARRIAELNQLHQAIATAADAIPTREAELATAQKHLDEYASVIAEKEAKLKSAAAANAAAQAAVEAARAEHANRAEIAKAIAAAAAAADAAKKIVPDDTVLADAVSQLQSRAGAAQADVGEAQQKVDAAAAAHASASESLAPVQAAFDAAVAERTAREKALAAAGEALAAAKADVPKRQSEYETAIAEIADYWASDFTVASLKPLTPEQLCWTVFRVTGVYDRYWKAEVAELDKTSPLSDEQLKDPAQIAAREIELEQRTYDKLKGNLGTFVAFYAAAAGQPQGDFFSTADQALFAANGGSINSWVTPAGDNVTERITKTEDPRVAAEELYLGVLTRMPTDEEIEEVTTHLASRAADKNAAAQELVWALLNSAEFRFNH